MSKLLPGPSSLFQTLPAEVIGEIFLSCIDSGLVSPKEAPLLLTHISSGLRHIALKTPALWAKLRFVVYESRGTLARTKFRSLKMRTRQIKELVNRSGSLPLYIQIEVPNVPVTVETVRSRVLYRSEIPGFMQTLASNCAPRLRHLILHPDIGTATLQSFLMRGADFTPLLHSLSLKSLKWSVAFPETHNLCNAHSLRELFISDCRITCLHDLRVCWANLTVFKLSTCPSVSTADDLHIVIRTLRQTTQLVSLSLELKMVNIQDSDGTFDHIVTLPHLKTFDLWIFGDPETLLIPNYLKTPALEKLHVKFNCFNMCQNLLEHSPLLQSLQISGISAPSWFHYTLAAQLIYCPQLTSLVLEWDYSLEDAAINILEIFVKGKGGKAVCPNLCEFRCTRIIRTTFNSLSRFLGIQSDDSLPKRHWEKIIMDVNITDWNEEQQKQPLETFVRKKVKAGTDLLQLRLVNLADNGFLEYTNVYSGLRTQLNIW